MKSPLSNEDFLQSKGRLSNLQECFIHVMFLWEKAMREKNHSEGECTFCSGFFKEMLGISWQGYHNSLMDELERLGWITCVQPSGRARFYRLTDLARHNLREHMIYANHYAWYI